MNLATKRGVLILHIISLIAVITSLFLPVWVISMKTPFLEKPLTIALYPLEGIVGDLRNLNIANHYVGLGDIHPEKIPELAYVPLVYYTYIALMVLMIVVNSKRKKSFYAISLVYIILLAALPIYMYSWMYKYTHTVNPNAPIRLEPFDPPFFGIYKLANFDITSYLGPAFFLPLAAAIIQLVTNKRTRT